MGAFPLVEASGAPFPIVLPRLVGLRLCGLQAAVVGFLDFISMSSSLQDIVSLVSPTIRVPRLLLVPPKKLSGPITNVRD